VVGALDERDAALTTLRKCHFVDDG
jgi:hypothetical protein